MGKLGIDFGTTNTVVVGYDKEKNEFEYFDRKNELKKSSNIPMSSTIMFHDDKETIGNDAKYNYLSHLGDDGYHFEKSIKLKLGRNKQVKVFGTKFECWEIASKIIKVLNNKTKYYQDFESDNAVFTVPIKFSGESRRDLRKAAEKAGYEVTTFIHEPFAALVGYFFNKQNMSFDEKIKDINANKDEYFLIFDWGGGTLDITVVNILDGKMLEVGTSELTNVAGDKFDSDIVDYVWNIFANSMKDEYSFDELEIVKKKNIARLIETAEQCKKDLSYKEKTEFLIEFILDYNDIDLILTREELNSILKPYVDKALLKIDDAIRKAGIKSGHIKNVLLTGGTCNIPYIQGILSEKFGHRLLPVTNSDLLIAQGAAVISELGWRPFLTKNINILMCDDTYYPLVSCNTIISNEEYIGSERFICVDHKEGKAKILIYEGYDKPSNTDKLLGILNVPIPNLNISSENNYGSELEVKYCIDNDIVLNIEARSFFVKGYRSTEEFSEQVEYEINELCFGLRFDGDNNEQV